MSNGKSLNQIEKLEEKWNLINYLHQNYDAKINNWILLNTIFFSTNIILLSVNLGNFILTIINLSINCLNFFLLLLVNQSRFIGKKIPYSKSFYFINIETENTAKSIQKLNILNFKWFKFKWSFRWIFFILIVITIILLVLEEII